MITTPPATSKTADMGDQWRGAARSFYARGAAAKADPARRRAFVRAYARIGRRLQFDATRRLLDIGCGAGELAEAVAAAQGQYCGIDVSPESLQLARRHRPDAWFILADATRLPLKGRFDCAAMVTALEFIADKPRALGQVYDLLPPGGLLYVEVRNGDFLLLCLVRPFLGLVRRMSLVRDYPADGFRDLSFAEWKQLLGQAGFRVIRVVRSVRPLWYGDLPTRLRNSLIGIVRLLLPVRLHYMVGFVLCRDIR